MCLCACVCVCVSVCVLPERLVVINGLSPGWKNINSKLNLDELPQIDKPEGKLSTHTHTHKLHLCLREDKTQLIETLFF